MSSVCSPAQNKGVGGSVPAVRSTRRGSGGHQPARDQPPRHKKATGSSSGAPSASARRSGRSGCGPASARPPSRGRSGCRALWCAGWSREILLSHLGPGRDPRLHWERISGSRSTRARGRSSTTRPTHRSSRRSSSAAIRVGAQPWNPPFQGLVVARRICDSSGMTRSS